MKRKKQLRKAILYLPLSVLICFVMFPYIWTFLTSIKPTNELYTTSIKILPQAATLENYSTLFFNTDFFASMLQSIWIAATTSCISMVVSSMAAYAFARYDFPGKPIALSGILLLYMFPGCLYLTPLFVIFNKLKLIGSPAALVISYCTFTIPFSIWLLTSYIKGIPIELEESGKIDGASVPQLLYFIVAPLLKPGLIATGTYVFINSWNEYLFAVMFTTSENRTLPVSLASLVGEYDLRWDIISAGAVAAMVPVVIMFMLVQKNLVAGLTAGSVKG